MKKNNKGFIAISLIYSFFLVFLMTLLAIVADYAHNRILLNNIKKSTQEKLNNLSEFNPAFLVNTNYQKNQEISYAGEKWSVLKDNAGSVILVLQRSLTKEEVESAINFLRTTEEDYNFAVSENKISMCLAGYSTHVCCYKEGISGKMDMYTWDNSLVKKIIDYWISNHALLQKSYQKSALAEMTYNDNVKSDEYATYIRIPKENEFVDPNIWTLSYFDPNNDLSKYDKNQSYLYVTESETNTKVVPAHSTKLEIKPVIEVRKST